MSTDNRQTVSWVYELNKEELVNELLKRELSIVGNFAVLRQRLLRAVRVTLNPLEISPSPSEENLDRAGIENPLSDSNVKGPNNTFEMRRISVASQTEMDSSYFDMLDELIAAGKLPNYSRDTKHTINKLNDLLMASEP